MTMHIRIDDLRGAAVQALLQVHLYAVHELSPPGSVHALDLEELRHSSVTFLTAWDGDELMGCGALKQLNPDHAELKSMRTAEAHTRKGVARTLLRHIELTAIAKGIQRISLETGTPTAFVAAHKLYASEGYVETEPFADYVLDPFSMFMTKVLQPASEHAVTMNGDRSEKLKQVLAIRGKLHLRDESAILRALDTNRHTERG